MAYAAAAMLVLALHLAFVLFVAGGALLVLRWPRLAWLHLPAAVWGVFIEVSGRGCPVTLLENALRMRAGLAGYAEGFLEHYLLGLVYPDGLTRTMQFLLAFLVLTVNAALYARMLNRRHAEQRKRALAQQGLPEQ